MGYPEKSLNPGEQIAIDVRPHWKYLAGPIFAVAVVVVGSGYGGAIAASALSRSAQSSTLRASGPILSMLQERAMQPARLGGPGGAGHPPDPGH